MIPAKGAQLDKGDVVAFVLYVRGRSLGDQMANGLKVEYEADGRRFTQALDGRTAEIKVIEAEPVPSAERCGAESPSAWLGTAE